MLARSLRFWCQSRVSSTCRRAQSSSSHTRDPSSDKPVLHTDDLGLPLSPLWSVHALINSYPTPKLSNATLTRLHDLAALIPPAEGTPEFERLKSEMEDLVRLVEAVRIAPEVGRKEDGPPDGRVWAQDRGIALESPLGEQTEPNKEPPSGRELLEHAPRTKDGLYLVDSARTKGS